MTTFKARNGLNYDRDGASVASALSMVDADGVMDVGKTMQSFKEECDINTLVQRFGLTGEMPEDFRPPQEGDFTGVTDFQSALNSVIAAKAEFLRMPAALRERFANDPQRLLMFLSDSSNRDEAVKLGLIPAPPAPEAGKA